MSKINERKDVKKAVYVTPRLTIYGKVTELTMGGGGKKSDAAVGGGRTKK